MKYLPVRVGTLRAGVMLSFDVYVILADRHVLYVRQKESFEEDRLTRLKAKGVKKLYIESSAEESYLAYLDAGLGGAPGSQTTPEQRAEIAQDSLSMIAQNAEAVLSTEAAYQAAGRRVERVAEFLSKEKGSLRRMLQSAGFALDDGQHAVNVASLTLALAAKKGISEPRELAELGLAALLHDVARDGVRAPESGKIEDLPPAHQEIYRNHPTQSAERVASKAFVTERVVNLIRDHEERGEGAGFPGKKRLKTLPLGQQILNLCNAYDHLCTEQKLSPIDAFKVFFTSQLGFYDQALIQALGEVIRLV